MKRVVGALLALALLVGIYTSPRWIWHLARPRALAVTVVDKTVPFRRYREHEALHWLLRAMKVTLPSGRFAQPELDYVGYNPVARVGRDLRAEEVSHRGLLFIADTYGVYHGDYERPGEVAALERSPRIYGGLQADELTAMEGFAARGGLILAEFNTFASPTEPAVRARAEQLFGARWTRWVARYWPNLQDPEEVPRWVGRVYERVHHRPFDLTGGGLVFVREDEDILVLREGEHLTTDVITQERTEIPATDLGSLPERGRFTYWLDVVEATDADTLYEHRVHATASGLALLGAHGIPARFPAVLRRRGGPDVWYFAGDFVDSGVEKGPAERAFIIERRRFTGAWLGAHSIEATLWSWYLPLTRSILRRRLAPGWL